jgi:hypothetical protein
MRGEMPLGPWGGGAALTGGEGILAAIRGLLTGGGRSLAEVTPDLVEAGPVARQMMPTGGDVDALTGALKYGLAKVPQARALQAPVQGLARAVPSASESMAATQSARDLLNPTSGARMNQMYQEANPVFRGLEDAGTFAGPRNIQLPSPLGERVPEFTPQGGEADYNTVNPSPPRRLQPDALGRDATVGRYLNKLRPVTGQ